MATNTITVVRGNALILTVVCYDADGVGMTLGADADGVLFSVRAAEDSANALLQKAGYVEYRGTSTSDPGVISVELLRQDTEDVATGEHWYDFEVRFTGHYYDWDADRYKGDLGFPYDYGKVYVEGEWIETPLGRVTLTDDSINFVELSPEGVVSANTVGWTEGSYPLYMVLTASGAILYTWPDAGFGEGTHSGLDFAYEAGTVVLEDLTTASVVGGTVTLEDDATNYIEVSDAGVVSANTDGFTAGAHALYTAVTASGAITTVTAADAEDLIRDFRTIYTRGDRFVTLSKERFNLLYPITQETESAAVYNPELPT